MSRCAGQVWWTGVVDRRGGQVWRTGVLAGLVDKYDGQVLQTDVSYWVAGASLWTGIRIAESST